MSYPRLKKMTPWGPAHTVQHAKYTDKARWQVNTPGNIPQYEHILVWEWFHGRKLPPGWVVHHIDEDPLNNDPSNLEAMTREAHLSLHKLRVMRSHFIVDGVEHKRCRSCGGVKPLPMFPLNGTTPAGTKMYRPICGVCDRERQRLLKLRFPRRKKTVQI